LKIRSWIENLRKIFRSAEHIIYTHTVLSSYLGLMYTAFCLCRYVDKTGHLVKDTDRIATNYLKFWFWIDL